MSELNRWLEEKLLALNLTDTMDVPEGFSRLSFTEEEKQSHQEFTKIAKELGLFVQQDEIGNQWAIWEVDPDEKTIVIGSHLDTVYGGGGYDGAAGVVAALGAIKRLKDTGFVPKKNLAVVSFISEESARFAVSTIGSKAVTGQLQKTDIARLQDKDGVYLQDAVEAFGLNWDAIEKAEIPAEKIDTFLELHIEQGAILEEANASIGVVKGIACPVRLKIRVTGMANHTGTTPMNQRNDAFVASAPIITFVQEEALKWNEKAEEPLVATVSTVDLKPNAINVIPGEVELGIDIRSVSDDLKRSFAEAIQTFCQTIEEKTEVTIEIETLVDTDSVQLDDTLHAKLLDMSRNEGFETISMNSGAGHDVMNMARKWPSGLLFIPCRDGISHHPKEHAEMKDLEKGVRVLVRFLKSEAGHQS